MEKKRKSPIMTGGRAWLVDRDEVESKYVGVAFDSKYE